MPNKSILQTEIKLFSRIKFVDKLMFTKHLATMIKAGIPIDEALETLSEHGSASFRNVIAQLTDDVNNGKSLSESMRRHPSVFDQMYVSLIEISEESGTLEENLVFLSEQMSKDYELRQKIKSAMLYPGLLLTVSSTVGGFIGLFVLPQLVNFFEALSVDLPLSTRMLLFVSRIMRDYGLLIVALAVLLAFGFFTFTRLPGIKPFWHRFLLKIPVIGKMNQAGQLARFSRNFGILLKSGVVVTKSLEVAIASLSNLAYQHDLTQVLNSLDKGSAIAETMSKEGFKLFPPLMTRMIRVGEQTGSLDETMIYLAGFYEDEIDSVSKNFTTLLEPVLLVSIGLMVAVIAMAIISPIYELTGSIGR